MSYELDRDRVMEFVFDNISPATVCALKEKDYWQRSVKVVMDALSDPEPTTKADICPLCQKGGPNG